MKKISIKSFKDKIYNLMHKNKHEPKKRFGSNFVIGFYDQKEIKNKYYFHISDPSYKKEYENFIYIKPEATIEFGSIFYNDNELDFLYKLKETIEHLEKHNRLYNISIYIQNFQNLDKSGILNITKNINLKINNDFDIYTKDEFIETQNKLNELIKPIKRGNLSPYEKYLAVYNLVKNFKEYKDTPENPLESRNLKYVLNKDYKSMVCVGYAKLLKELLTIVEIESKEVVVFVDTSYDEGYTMEEIPTKLEGHVRNIIKIDDDKYNIHGIYLSDPTWDNSKNKDLYNNHALTFDKIKEAYRLEELEKYDILLDFHNFKDFNTKINYFLKKEINSSPEKELNQKIIQAYEELFERIMQILREIDYQKYEYFNKKYQKKIEEYIKIGNFKDIENIFTEFLTEYANYIIPLSNKEINKDITYKAVLNVKREIDGYDEEELKEWENKTRTNFEKVEKISFPYIYNPNEKRNNYLESKPKILTKEK